MKSGAALTVTDGELAAVDEYERPFNYRRILVTMGSGRDAWAYVSA